MSGFSPHAVDQRCDWPTAEAVECHIKFSQRTCFITQYFASPPVAVRIIAMNICMSVLLHISKTSSVNFLYVLIVAVNDDGMLCTSGFVDDVMFARNRQGKGNANTPK